MEDFDLSTVGKTSEAEQAIMCRAVNETIVCEAKKIVKVKKPNFPKGILKKGKNKKNEKNKGKKDVKKENDGCVEKLDDRSLQDVGEKGRTEDKEKNKGKKDDKKENDGCVEKLDDKSLQNVGEKERTEDKEKNKGKKDDKEENDNCVEKLDDKSLQNVGEKGRTEDKEKNKGKKDDKEENNGCVEKLDDRSLQDVVENEIIEDKKSEKNKDMKEDGEEISNIGGGKSDKADIKHKGSTRKSRDNVEKLRNKKRMFNDKKIDKEMIWTPKLKVTLLKNKKNRDSCDGKLDDENLQELGESCHVLVETRMASEKGEAKKTNCEEDVNNDASETYNTDISDKVKNENYTKTAADIEKPGDDEKEKEKDMKKKRKIRKFWQRKNKTKNQGKESRGVNGDLVVKDEEILEKKNKRDKDSCKDMVNKKDIIKKEGEKISKNKIAFFKKVRKENHQLKVVDNVIDGRVNCNDMVESVKTTNKESGDNTDVSSINERLI